MPKDPGKVVLHSTIDVQDGILAVLAGLADRGWTATVLLENPARAALLRTLAGVPVRTARKRSLNGALHFLRARYVRTTHNVYSSCRPPRSQIHVNLWHGEPGSKITGRFAGRGGVPGTYAPVCSSIGCAFRAAMFDVEPLQVPITGAPRNDRMLRTDARATRRALLGDDPRPTFLWLPTYRTGRWGNQLRVDVAADGAGQHAGLPYPHADLARLDAWLVEAGAAIVVKPHPRDAGAFDDHFQAIRVLRNEQLQQQGHTVYTALPAFDGLLTDVSSVWLDYLLLDKPLIFAFPDIDSYRRGRGVNLEPYDLWVPGPFSRTMDELIGSVRDLVEGRDPMAAERATALRRFHRYRDDGSTGRLLDGLGILATGAAAGQLLAEEVPG